jgi:ABC-type antimicrobial peptide transport system ATPase subunit
VRPGEKQLPGNSFSLSKHVRNRVTIEGTCHMAFQHTTPPQEDGGRPPRLSRLLDPVDADTFLAEHWERRPLLVRRNDPKYHADLVAGLPHGYDTVLGKWFGGVELSGGEWQKIALGRAFMRDAPVLVLDEPTAALDARAEHDLFTRLAQLSQGRTALYISHRFSTVRQADQIVVVDSGRLIEQGTHQELMARDGTYAALFTLQTSAYLDDDAAPSGSPSPAPSPSTSPSTRSPR